MTNDTITEAIVLDTFDGEQPTEAVPPRRRRPNRWTRRMAAAVAAVAVAAGVGGALALAGGDDSRPAASDRTAADVAVTVPPTADPGAAPAPADPSAEAGDAGEGTPDPEPPAAPGHLVAGTTNIVLGTNEFSASFELTNDGGSDVEWQWMSGHPAIATAPSGGVLAPGETVVVELTISWQQLDNGNFVYQNHVVSDGQSIKVTVSGERDIEVNPGVELPEPALTPLDD